MLLRIVGISLALESLRLRGVESMRGFTLGGAKCSGVWGGGHMLARRSGGRSARWRSQVCALHAAVWGVRLCRGGGMGVWAQDGHRSHPVPQIRSEEDGRASGAESRMLQCCYVGRLLCARPLMDS